MITLIFATNWEVGLQAAFFCAFEFLFVCLVEKRVEVSEYFKHYLNGLFGWFENSLDRSRILDFPNRYQAFLVNFKKG